MTTTEAEPALRETALRDAGVALRTLAADPACRKAFISAPLLGAVLRPAADRYVVAAERAGLLARLAVLAGRGYRVGAEFVGEEATALVEIEHVCDEYLRLIAESAGGPAPQLGFDLSNVGLLVSRELAVDNTARILRAARDRGVEVVLSMERSEFVDRILSVYEELAAEHPNLGLTVQAHLRRTPADLDRVAAAGGKVRLVKGVYREDTAVALPRGPKLVERYLDLVGQLLDRGVRLACGTHDAAVLAGLERRGLLGRLEEIDMLHGVRPDLLRRYRERGTPCRVSAVYGTNWWLHLLHRLAEHPTNVLTALADLADPDRTAVGHDY